MPTPGSANIKTGDLQRQINELREQQGALYRAIRGQDGDVGLIGSNALLTDAVRDQTAQVQKLGELVHAQAVQMARMGEQLEYLKSHYCPYVSQIESLKGIEDNLDKKIEKSVKDATSADHVVTWPWLRGSLINPLISAVITLLFLGVGIAVGWVK